MPGCELAQVLQSNKSALSTPLSVKAPIDERAPAPDFTANSVTECASTRKPALKSQDRVKIETKSQQSLKQGAAVSERRATR